tara:strand:- start:390 stop:1592 length:1203 start_codon:yes stop_codon:yes gene_type:complete
MALYKFGPNDVFVSRLKTYPHTNFLIYSGSYYYNSKTAQSGAFSNPVKNVPVGNISLYELNIDRPSDSLIYPFTTKEGSLDSFNTVSTNDFMGFDYGDTITGSYFLSATIDRRFYLEYVADLPIPASNVSYRPHIMALKNTTNDYMRLSPHYEYSASLTNPLGGWDKDRQMMTMISIPSIFYGSSIKKGSVDLKFYTTGTLAGQLLDYYKNGELIQFSGAVPANDGKCAGTVLYDQGIILLTGSWTISGHREQFRDGATQYNTAWVYFGASGSAGNNYLLNSSFTLDFKGTEKIPNITMLAHAPQNKLNNSNNPTFLETSTNANAYVTGSTIYKEYDSLGVKNIVKSPYNNYTASFQRETYISEIGIYDKDKNLIAIAKLANPIKKTEEKDFTFKLSVDI